MWNKVRTRVFAPTLFILLLAAVPARAASAARLDPALAAKLANLSNSSPVGTVIVSFDTSSGLRATDMTALLLAGVARGYLLPNLGMAAAPATAGQVRALAGNPAVRSLWLNGRLRYLDGQTRVLAGADRVHADPGFAALHQGLPVTGQGIGVLVNDSGIDATHPDLAYGTRVVQNVLSMFDITTVAGLGLLPAIEGVPDTDTHVGHGTHCAGVLGGSGEASGGRYAGVAPGAHLIGFGSGAVIYMLNALAGFEYALANRSRYNIRIISNSWGRPGAYDPDSPVAIASRAAHDRGIVVVFAAGNWGPGYDTLTAEAKSPWVISVAAGTKEGGLAAFSSRGVPRAQRAAGDLNAPTITAPGAGRQLAGNAGRFTAGVVSARARTGLTSNGGSDDLELDPADLFHYTQLSGTSMAAPFVAGVAALMLSADPALTPGEVRAILVQTASQMPGFSEFEVGAGYVDAYAAVDKVLHRAKPYGTFGGPLDLQTFRLPLSSSVASQAPFHVDYDPLATPGPGGANSFPFTVASGTHVLDVAATADAALMTGDGNSVALLLIDPEGRMHASGMAIPILDSQVRQVVVADPVPGTWWLEIRGLRGLAAVPQVMLPLSGAALPGPVDGTITQRVIGLPAIADIQGDPARAEIEHALRSRMMDVLGDGLFHPAADVSRADLARTLVLNTALRQSLADGRVYMDAQGSLEAIAQAVTADGSTLRDWDFTPSGMLAAAAPVFHPDHAVSRLDLAVALVKALGLDAAALALAGSHVTVSSGGQTLAVSDEEEIPAALRGYVQIAFDLGLLSPAVTAPPLAAAAEPGRHVSRAGLASALGRYRRVFSNGN